MSENTNPVYRIYFEPCQVNVVKPGAVVVVSKSNIINSALQAKQQGRIVDMSALTSAEDSNKIHLNDLEEKYRFMTSILGTVLTVEPREKGVIKCKIEVPSVSIDNKPMVIWFNYSDAQVVKNVRIVREITKNEEVALSTDLITLISGTTAEATVQAVLIEDVFNGRSLQTIIDCGIPDLSIVDKIEVESSFNSTIDDPLNLTDDQKADINEIIAKFDIPVVADDSKLVPAMHVRDEAFKTQDWTEQLQWAGSPIGAWTAATIKPIEKAQISNEYSHDSHVMVDLETLSTEHDAAIVEITLTRFTPKTGEVHESLKVNFDIDELLRSGFDVSKSTLIDFWLSQPEKVRNRVLTEGQRLPLEHGWALVYKFLKNIKNVKIWGKGPSFDVSKMAYTMKQVLYDQPLPWSYWNERCVRTINAIDSVESKSIDFVGDKHDSYYDTLHQIKQVSTIIKKYNLA